MLGSNTSKTEYSLVKIALIGSTIFLIGGVAWWLLDEEGWSTARSLDNGKESSFQNASEEFKKKNARTHKKLSKLNKSPEGRFAMLADPNVRWQVRVDYLRRLDASTLTAEEIDDLFSMLEYKPIEGEETWWVVVNEIMEQIREQSIAPERYTAALVSLINNKQQGEVLRDYAIQHLALWMAPREADSLNRRTSEAFEQDPQKVALGVETITAIITDPSVTVTSIPGTALMALVDGYQHGGELAHVIDQGMEQLDPWLNRTIKTGDGASVATRVSAINAVAMMKRKSFLPILRDIVSTIEHSSKGDEGEASVKLSSVAVMGIYAEEQDRKILKQIASGNSKYKYAAKEALKNFQPTTEDLQ